MAEFVRFAEALRAFALGLARPIVEPVLTWMARVADRA